MEHRLYDTEYRFMEIIWEHAPVRSGELVTLCKDVLGWKKSTTYTMIKRLAEKGYIINENAVVHVLLEKERCQQEESKEIIEKNFGGSLPSFIAAFLRSSELSDDDAKRIKKIIDDYQVER